MFTGLIACGVRGFVVGRAMIRSSRLSNAAAAGTLEMAGGRLSSAIPLALRDAIWGNGGKHLQASPPLVCGLDVRCYGV